jgi:hypothetical protein
MTDRLPVKIRSIKETDHALILDSWVNSVCYSTPAYFWVPQKLCKSIYRRMVGQLLEVRPELFRVLVNEDDEDQIFGWVCGDDRVTHFVFVKREFRGEELATCLIEGLVGGKDWVFTHWSKDCERINHIDYKPSLFQELINGISKTVGRGVAENDEHAREGGADSQNRRDGQAVRQAVGMVS